MRKFLLLITFLSVFGAANAQKGAPDWFNPYNRESKYPSDRYLVGLSTELVPKGKSLADIYKQLNQLSRNQIIESIHVNVKSETKMNITIVNTESNQLLDQNSVSISNAKLVGLKFENYYHKKKKLAFSFSYVSIQELVDYNLSIIQTNTNIIDKNVSLAGSKIVNGDKEGAIELLFESQIKMKEIQQSAVLLMSLGMDNRLDFNKIGQMKLDIAQGTDDFFNKGTLNVHELSSFYAYGLQLQIGDTPFSVCTGKIMYQNSGNESRFSVEFKNRILNKLSDLESVKLAESGCNFTFEGTFTEANGKVIMVTNFVDSNGKVRATVNNKFPLASLQFGDLAFLPENFEYITALSSIKLEVEKPDYLIKKVNLYKHPIKIMVSSDGTPLSDIPVHFIISKGESIQYETDISSDKSGMVTLILNKDQIKKSGKLVLNTIINVSALLDINADSEFYNKVLLENPPQNQQTKLNIIAPTVFIKASEASLGSKMGIPLLAPAIKKTLIDLDYKFVDSAAAADYTLNIEASTRKGQSSQYMFFSYLDATIAMYDNSTDKEIYKNGFSSVKGGGSSYELASIKAYEKAINSFVENFISELGQ